MSIAGFAQTPASPTLKDMKALIVQCDDCGNQKRLSPETLAALYDKGVRCEAELRPKLICSACKARGLYGRNLGLIRTYNYAP